MWNSKKVSLVMATYREKDSIRRVIEDFLATGLADEVIVVDNNAEQGTREELAKITSPLLRVVHEPKQGYGHAFKRGYREATGDLIVTIEPDGTYVGKDLKKFLLFSDEFPAVMGSRCILKTTNKDWGYWRREVNILYGYIMHLLFNTQMVTDIGCTYKLIDRATLMRIAPAWRHGSSLFATELFLSVLREGVAFTEIPVTFTERVGASVVIGSRIKLAKLACEGMWQILEGWFSWKFRNNKYPPLRN